VRIWKRLLIPTLLCAVLFAPLLAPIQAHEPQPPPTAASPAAYAPGQLLVKFRPEASAAARGSRLAALGLSTLQEMGDLGLSLLAVPAGQEQAMIERLRQDPLVEFAEPNYRVGLPKIVADILPTLTRPELTQLAVSSTVTCTQLYTPVIPNDYYYSSQWNLPKICLPEAWSATTGAKEAVIAVLASGIDLQHPDLQSKIWTNPGENPCNGLDDEGNGFVDDVHGWNFVADNNDVTDDSAVGTIVAGVAAAATNNNGEGVAGVSWGAKILPIRVFGANYADISDLIAGVYYAANVRQRWQMPMVILLGGYIPTPSEAYQTAVSYAHEKGCLLVAGVGDMDSPCNENINWLAAATYVIAVSATDENDNWVGSSQCGFYVDLCAPGTNIIFPIPNGSYAVGRSTMLAAAHVAGLASLIWSVNPTYPADLVEILMRWTAVDLGVPGWDMYFGYGRIDASRAVQQAIHYLRVLPNDHRLIFVHDPTRNNPPPQTITNPGTSCPTWQVETDVPWLSITPVAQNTPSIMLVSLDPDPLYQHGYGIYTGHITVTSTITNSQNNPQVFTVTAAYTYPVQTLRLQPLFYRYLNPNCGP
jgi:subtilisin family serine protease